MLTNPLSNNLTSTSYSHTQQSSTNNMKLNSLNTFPPTQTSNTLRPTLQNSQFQLPNPLQQKLEQIPTFITHLPTILQILQMFLHTIQYHHLQYLKTPFHNRHISTLLLQYQNLLNLFMA